ncbi:MAG: chemotaxis protein CheB [Desulfobulbaceae bacterium]|nr:MAG: chemotaxis protein CheB [Desulfobulbaceae bacterium]
MKNRQNSIRIQTFEAIVIGVSAGGLAALARILPKFKKDFPLAVLIVQHMRRDADGFLWRHLDTLSRLTVKEAEDKEAIQPQTVYIAPPDYHLLVEPDRTLSLSAEARVNFSRPSIDVLFETAAETYQQRLIGVILTGANNDGTRGLKTIKSYGGLAVVQSPESAESDAMPRSAIEEVAVDHIVPLDRMGRFLNDLACGNSHG